MNIRSEKVSVDGTGSLTLPSWILKLIGHPKSVKVHLLYKETPPKAWSLVVTPVED